MLEILPSNMKIKDMVKRTHKIGPIWQVGVCDFDFKLVETNGEVHKLSASGVGTGFGNNSVEKFTKEGIFKMLNGVLHSWYVKPTNPFGGDLIDSPLYWVNNYINIEIFGDNSHKREIKLKSFTTCSLYLCSFQINMGLDIAETSIDFYLFIAGHQFIPWHTAYVYIKSGIKFPILQFMNMIHLKQWKESLDFSIMQYWCPFIGIDSTSATTNAKLWVKDVFDPDDSESFKRPPMISP